MSCGSTAVEFPPEYALTVHRPHRSGTIDPDMDEVFPVARLVETVAGSLYVMTSDGYFFGYGPERWLSWECRSCPGGV